MTVTYLPAAPVTLPANVSLAQCPDCGAYLRAGQCGEMGLVFRCPLATCGHDDLAAVDIYLEHDQTWQIGEGGVLEVTTHTDPLCCWCDSPATTVVDGDDSCESHAGVAL